MKWKCASGWMAFKLLFLSCRDGKFIWISFARELQRNWLKTDFYLQLRLFAHFSGALQCDVAELMSSHNKLLNGFADYLKLYEKSDESGSLTATQTSRTECLNN